MPNSIPQKPEQETEHLRQLFHEDEKRLLVELSQFGLSATSLDDLRRSGKRYKDAIPTLLRWLKKTDSLELKESIVRALSFPWVGREVRLALIEEYERRNEETAHFLKWAIGNALEVLADDSVIDELIDIVLDKRNGSSRQMVVLALGKMKKGDRIIPVLLKLLDDEDVVGHAISSLGRLKARETKSSVEKFLTHKKAWIRKEAKHALKKMLKD